MESNSLPQMETRTPAGLVLFHHLTEEEIGLFSKTGPGYNLTGSNQSAGRLGHGGHATPSDKYWALGLLVIPLLTVFGNILVCMSVYKEKSLQTVTNYFIVSLAIADIAVAILVMPFAIYVEVSFIKTFSMTKTNKELT